MVFIAAIARGLELSFDWRGRASRAEFWLFQPLPVLCYVLTLVSISELPILAPLFGLAWLGLLVPALGVGVRRLHDTNRSGGWYFISLVPYAGVIVLLVFYCSRSDRGDNRYGPPPAPLRPSSTVERGMTRRQIRRLLGPPQLETDAESHVHRTGAVALVGHRLLNGYDYWYYPDIPAEGRETMIVFDRGRVVHMVADGG
jgi:uncharacterized membrane protein YhaH (DUF805 family)